MLITEWDTEEAQEVWFEEGVEAGLARGLERGREEGREEGVEVGLERGREEGWLALAQLLQEGKTLDEAMTYLKGPTAGAR